MKYCVVTPWWNPEQKHEFLESWNIKKVPDWLILQQDKNKDGCARTKNKGIKEALRRKANFIIVLDDDCTQGAYQGYWQNLSDFAELHVKAFAPQPINLYEVVTNPPSRGTPYTITPVLIPVAATVGFWQGYYDYDAVHQLTYKNQKMTFKKEPMFWKWFTFCGMNCAFRAEFWPHFKFDETADRYDDIWMGWRLQKEAYRRGYCINLNGPEVYHNRQSNVWRNLQIESENIERNEHEWRKYVP